MGFFQSILGGSSQSSQSGGFNQLPPEIRGAYTNFGTQIQDLLKGGNLTKMYTPLKQTAGETKAYNAINKGFTPDAAQLQSDIAMQQNPYDHYVIDEINRQAGGDYSLLKQSLSEAGQMGSNRQNLGANDIDLSRLNQIGQFKQQGYESALKNAFSTLPGLRQQDAQNQLGAGANQRELYGQTQQAPLEALQQIAKALGILPTVEGSSSSKGSSSNGIGSLLPGLAKLSDRRLKENIKPLGEENGFPVYEFNYIGDSQRLIGVMAQDVAEIMPAAVVNYKGYMAVNYPMIGVKFREAV
jgi:hypothetical protein